MKTITRIIARQRCVAPIIALLAVMWIFTISPAGASVIWTDLGAGIYLKGTPSSEAIYEFDADNDSLTDVRIYQIFDPSEGYNEAFFQMKEMGPGARDHKTRLAIGFIADDFYFAKAFPTDAVIGSGENWADVDMAGGFIDFEYSEPPDYIEGEWWNMPDYTGYAGFNFYSTIDSAWHYGWLHLKVDNQDDSAVTLFGYAWETDANTAIMAGDTGAPVPIPGAVWLMGSGLLGLVGIRRKNITLG